MRWRESSPECRDGHDKIGRFVSIPVVSDGPPAPPGSPVFRRLAAALHYRDFRVLWCGAATSSIGTWIQDVALSWVIHTEFKNPAYLGWRQFASELPLVAFMLLGGVLADRFNKKTILMASQLIQLILALVLASLYFTGRLSIWSVVAGTAHCRAFSCCWAFATSSGVCAMSAST